MEVDQARIDKGMYWNQALSLVEGCTPCGSECRKCWSAEQTHRRRNHPTPKTKARYSGLTNDAGKFNGTVRFMEADLDKPLRTKKPTVWAVWNDLFHPKIRDRHIAEAFGVMAACPEHTFWLLTKRPIRMANFIECTPRLRDGPLPNVHLGTTCGHPDSLWRIEELLRCPAAKRFVSCEPLLGELDFTRVPQQLDEQPAVVIGTVLGTDGRTFSPCGASGKGIDWLILGPETGRNARPSKPEWFESLIGQADAAGVPVFVKAFPVGDKVSKDPAEWPEFARRREFPTAEAAEGGDDAKPERA